MKNIIVILLSFTLLQSCFAQKVEPSSNSSLCDQLTDNREVRQKKIFEDKPCLLDFVSASIDNTSLLKNVGKDKEYIKYTQESCDDSFAEFTNKQGQKNIKITFSKEQFLLSNHEWNYDTTYFEEYDLLHLIPVGIDGLKVVGVEIEKQKFLDKQNIVSDIKIEFGNKKLVIPLPKEFLMFNPNFCDADKLLKPIEVYQISNNKIAVYIYGNKVSHGKRTNSDYISKIIIDLNKGYEGTIFVEEYYLRAYGWGSNKNFQGF